jgi:hypothetical protein
VLVGFRVARNGFLEPLSVAVPYPAPIEGHGNHTIDVKVIGRFLYFLQRRGGMVGRLTITDRGALISLANFSGLGVEPFAGSNPGIDAFRTRCFFQDPSDPAFSPECRLGSAVGITGF